MCSSFTPCMIIVFIIFIIAVWIIKEYISWNPSAERFYSEEKMSVLGHRGASQQAQENTNASIIAAFDQGANGVEVDIMKTLDNHIILHHDFDIKHPQNGNKYIADLTLEEIQGIHNLQFAGDSLSELEMIPQLDNIFDNIPSTGLINLEIKTRRVLASGFESELVRIIQDRKIIDRVLVSSFNPMVIRKIKKINKDIHTGLVWRTKDEWIFKRPPLLFSYIGRADAIHIDIHSATTELVDKCKRLGLKINMWTVNTMEEFKLAKLFGADGIITDEIKYILEIL